MGMNTNCYHCHAITAGRVLVEIFTPSARTITTFICGPSCAQGLANRGHDVLTITDPSGLHPFTVRTSG